MQVLTKAAAGAPIHTVILSDANTVFIDHILEAQDLQASARVFMGFL